MDWIIHKCQVVLWSLFMAKGIRKQLIRYEFATITNSNTKFVKFVGLNENILEKN